MDKDLTQRVVTRANCFSELGQLSTKYLEQLLQLPVGFTFQGTEIDNKPGKIYQLAAPIGRGGYGVVFRTVELESGQQAAVKVLPDNDAFKVESIAARTIGTNYPNVVSMIDRSGSRVFGDLPFLVYELVEGQTLREIQSQDKLSLTDMVEIYKQIANGLDSVHKRGYSEEFRLVHRDIKPGNVMVGLSGIMGKASIDVRIIDPGLCHSNIHAELTSESGTITGTPCYIAPEIILGLGFDGRSDLYSMGVMLLESLVGFNPFEVTEENYEEQFARMGEDPERYERNPANACLMMHLKYLPLSPSAFDHVRQNIYDAVKASNMGPGHASQEHINQEYWDVLAQVDGITMNLLNKDQNQRYNTAHDVMKDLIKLQHRISKPYSSEN